MTPQAQTHMPISPAGVLVPKDKAIKRFIVSCAGLRLWACFGFCLLHMHSHYPA